MVKKNEEESPRTLKKEELENVNGGGTKKRENTTPDQRTGIQSFFK